MTTERGTYGYGLGSFGALARIQLALEEPPADVARTLEAYAQAIADTGSRVFERELEELREWLAARSA